MLEQMSTALQENQSLNSALQSQLQAKDAELIDVCNQRVQVETELNQKLTQAKGILDMTQSGTEKIVTELKQDLQNTTKQKNEQEVFFKNKIAEVESQVREFLQQSESENASKYKALREETDKQIHDLEAALNQKEQLLRTQKKHSDEIMKEVVEITEMEQSRK